MDFDCDLVDIVVSVCSISFAVVERIACALDRIVRFLAVWKASFYKCSDSCVVKVSLCSLCFDLSRLTLCFVLVVMVDVVVIAVSLELVLWKLLVLARVCESEWSRERPCWLHSSMLVVVSRLAMVRTSWTRTTSSPLSIWTMSFACYLLL